MQDHTDSHIDEIIKRKRELKELYLSLLLRSFAISMISIFVPIYLLINGFLLTEVLLFYIIMNTVKIVIDPLTATLTSKIGIKRTLVLSAPTTIAFFGLLHFLESFQIPLYLISVIGAIALSLYWIPITSDFAKSGDKKHRGSQTALFNLMPKLAGIIAPVTGAFIAEFFGFQILFILISAIIVSSTIPLLASSDYKSKVTCNWQKYVQKGTKVSDLMFISGFMSETTRVLFPIYIFLTLNSVVGLGELGSILAIGTFTLTLGMKKLTDRFGKHYLIRVAGFIFLFGWLIIMSASDFYLLGIVAIILGLGESMFEIPLFTIETNEAHSRPTEFMTLRAMTRRLGMTIASALALLTGNLETVFLLAALLSAYVIIRKK
jgi:MFS family permease